MPDREPLIISDKNLTELERLREALIETEHERDAGKISSDTLEIARETYKNAVRRHALELIETARQVVPKEKETGRVETKIESNTVIGVPEIGFDGFALVNFECDLRVSRDISSGELVDKRLFEMTMHLAGFPTDRKFHVTMAKMIGEKLMLILTDYPREEDIR